MFDFDKIFKNNFLRLYFSAWSRFCSYSRINLLFFAFQLSFIIIVLLYCRHIMKYNCCLLFFGFLKMNCLLGFSSRKKVSHRKGIHRWLRLRQFMQALTADNRSFSKDFKFLTILVLSLPPQKMKYSWFEEGFATGFKSNKKTFTAEYIGKVSGITYSLTQELHPRWAWVIITVLSRLSCFVFKSGVIIYVMTCNEELTSIEEFTLIVASWVIRAWWRKIRRFVLEFKAS